VLKSRGSLAITSIIWAYSLKIIVYFILDTCSIIRIIKLLKI